jgi:hypothetical protein
MFCTFLAWELGLSVVRASMPSFVGDGELVDRSELIVIGRLQDGSVGARQHPRGFSTEHHATLIIEKVLKGKLRNSQIPLLIQHGLEVSTKGNKVVLEENVTQWPRASIPDAKQDQIWFLRNIHSGDGQPDAPRMLGVNQIHDVQRVTLTEYYKILLSPQPEAKLREYLKSRPRLSSRGVEYLESRELKRILNEADPALRYQKLLPYFLGAVHSATHALARRALVDGGPESGPYLMAAFQNPLHRRQRPEIIRIWRWTRYAGCADLLVRLLDENHKAYLDLHARLERQGVESGIDPQDVKQLASEVAAAIYALAEIGDPRADSLVEETRRRWQEVPTAPDEIFEAYNLAMDRIRKRKQRVRADSRD